MPCKNSGLSILMHGVISLPDATSYDKKMFKLIIQCRHYFLQSEMFDCQHPLKLSLWDIPVGFFVSSTNVNL